MIGLGSPIGVTPGSDIAVVIAFPSLSIVMDDYGANGPRDKTSEN